MSARSFSPRHKSGSVGRAFNGRKHIDALYDGEWEAVNGRCYRCGVEATVVDHLRPHQGDVGLFKQLDNHIPLCKPCHDQGTALFDRRFKTGGSIRSKLEWIQWSRAGKSLTFRVKVLPYYGSERAP
jgi:5-methylcytosine-specific restriction endonuclease McrA